MQRKWLTGALGLAALLAATDVAAQALDDGVVAYYPFNRFLTDFQGGYNGVISGGGGGYPDGASGYAFQLGGNVAVNFPGIPASTFAGDFSLSWFMKWEATAADSPQRLISRAFNCPGTRSIEIVRGLNGPQTVTFTIVWLESGGTVTAAVPDGVWTHVAAVREGGTIRLYVNGQAGAPATVPTSPPMNLDAVNPTLGLGNSPCIGSDDNISPNGRIDELRVYNRALAANEAELLSRRAQFRVSPDSAGSNAELRINAWGLVPGRTYQVGLDFPDDPGVAVTEQVATGESALWFATLPVLQNDGDADMVLSSRFGTRSVLERTLPFPIELDIGLSVSPPQPRAGRPVSVTLFDLLGMEEVACGSPVRVRYGSRVVAVRQIYDCTQGTVTFIAPSDYPSSFPAQVEIRVDELSGRQTVRSASATVTVAAPYPEPFVEVAGIDVSDPLPRPGEPVRVGGRMIIGDDTDPGQIETSAFWVANSGRITSLPTTALAIDANGDFRLDTFPPSLGSMAAFIPSGPGRIRLVTRRPGAFGRIDHVVTDGPLLQTDYAQFLASDLRITVRKNIGGGNSEPIEGAFVVVDANAPLEPPQANPPPGSGMAGWASGGQNFLDNTQPRLDPTLDPRDALNQISEQISQFELPPLPCGESLYRRYTNGAGQAGFQLAGGAQEPPDNWQELGFGQYQGGFCGNDGCRVAQDIPWEFNLTIYTLHRGAGYIGGSGFLANYEEPSQFKVTYTRDSQTYRIRNLRTGAVSVQTGSADIELTVPALTGADDFLTINDPVVYQEVGTQVSAVTRQGPKGYGKWIEFTGNVSEFANAAPAKVIRFSHVPAVNGSINEAKLYLPNVQTGQPSLIGTFNQVSFVEGCNIQDDPDAGNTETWELRVDQSLNLAWRNPRGVLFPADSQTRRTCGSIEVSNINGAIGSRQICFEWQAAPEYFNEAGGNLTVNDADMNRVLVQVSGDSLGDSSAQTPPAEPLFGEDVARPPATQSRTTSRRGLFDTITANGTGGAVRNYDGNNPQQFNEGAAGATQVANFDAGQTLLEIGDDEFKDILDVTIPLFQWYWGVPEILSAEVYARLRLLAAYYYYGTLIRENNRERLDMVTDALFAAEILIGVDIDVLFGFIVDAGASLVGRIQSEIPIVVENSVPQPVEPCITFRLDFYGYVDPCAFCPTPVIEFDSNIIDAQDPPSCSYYPNRAKGFGPDFLRAGGGDLVFGAAEARSLRRHPALAFDAVGNGQGMMVQADGSLQSIPFGSEAELVGPQTLSISPGVRQAKLAYYEYGRAIAVWMESALDQNDYLAADGDYQLLSSNQRIAWATYDGETWGTKQFLTEPGTGSGHPTLVACPNWDDDCPAGGEVFLAWQQNESGNPYQPRHRIRHATWRPNTGWTAPDVADPDLGQIVVQEITPSAIYVAGEPFLSWTRQLLGDLNNFAQRRLAYRHVGVGPAKIAVDLPDSMISPNLVAGPGGDDPEVLLAFTRPDDGTGPIGTSLALHIAAAQCFIGNCTWNWHRARDPRGRAVYGERPQFARGGFWSSIVMRTFRYEGPNGEPVQSGDTIGAILSSGDLVNLQPNYANGVVRVTPISADGAMHFGHAVAYDPGEDAVVTMSSVFTSGGFLPLRGMLKAGGVASVTGYGKTLAPKGMPGNMDMRALPALPDFVLESIEADSAGVSPGANVATLAKIGNRGTPYVAARDGAAFLELRWNSPVGAPVASIALSDLANGAEVEVPLAFAAPASAFADEAHTLYARITIAPELDELTGDNNAGEVAFAGLPVPTSLASQTRPGAPVVQLGWDENSDPRIAGYRVYLRAADGAWMPLGASPNHGFLDITAQFAVPRTYAVSAYSDRGIESARSESITAMPVQPGREGLDIFADGFEEPSP